jgi:hypothetical protein
MKRIWRNVGYLRQTHNRIRKVYNKSFPVALGTKLKRFFFDMMPFGYTQVNIQNTSKYYWKYSKPQKWSQTRNINIYIFLGVKRQQSMCYVGADILWFLHHLHHIGVANCNHVGAFPYMSSLWIYPYEWCLVWLEWSCNFSNLSIQHICNKYKRTQCGKHHLYRISCQEHTPNFCIQLWTFKICTIPLLG